MWHTFFHELGAEVVVSPQTTEAILSSGSSRVVAETCLPVKAFLGHVIYLAGKCDYVFIPALRSIKTKVYNCSKFLGLPDMTRAVIPESPPILEIDIDVNKGKRRLYQTIYKLGRHFTWDPLKVKRASLAAWQAHLDYRELMSSCGLTPLQAIEKIYGTAETKPKSNSQSGNSTSPRASVAVIGHPYLLYDEHLSHRILHRLEKAHSKVFVPEMLTTQELDSAVARLVGRAYWTYEEEVVGAGEHYLTGQADGVIGIMAFGCGPDSLMMDMVHRKAASLRTKPLMVLNLEEHTADTGVITRLEAFLDMIHRRKRRQVPSCV